MFEVDKKVVVVTGAAGGIGSAMVKAFKEQGSIVIAVDNQEIEVEADLVILNDIVLHNATIVNDILNSELPVDTVVNCVGVTRDTWETTIDTNLTALYRFNKRLVDYVMKKNEHGGSIINVTSLESLQGFPNSPAYAASKGGLRALTKSMARDYGQYNIRVNAIVPGYTATNMTKLSRNNPEMLNARLDRMILKRVATPEDIVGAAVFLASNESSYITGIDLIVDGGWNAKGL